MKLVVFGLTVSSSWGNGHATLWRGLVKALVRRGCEVVFYERDVPYYAMNRDLEALPGAELVMYDDSAHEILRERDEVRLRALAAIDSFLGRHAAE